MLRLSRARPDKQESARARRVGISLVGLTALTLLLGCAASVSTRHRHRRPPTEDEPETPPVKVEPWKMFGSLGSFKTVGEPRISGHRLGDEQGTIRIDAAATPYASGLPVPAGAVIVESLSPEVGGAPTVHFVMTKRQQGYFPAGGDWEYLVVDAAGGVLASGELPKCARCHAEAARGFLFGAANLTAKPADSR